jgi:SAM-dependent methyltransferase
VRCEIGSRRPRATGDYSVVGNSLVLVSEELCEAADLRSGARVLDVATGSGNAALAAARRWCDTIGTDYVPALLERARARADADGLKVEFREADADRQPFPDASFDAVLSVFGVMFAPDPVASARERCACASPAGRLALASWTPEGFIGQMFKTTSRHVPPPAGVSPAGGVGHARGSTSGSAARRRASSRRSALHLPLPLGRALRRGVPQVVRADGEGLRRARRGGQAALDRDLMALLQQHNRSGDATAVIPSEYLEVVVTKK